MQPGGARQVFVLPHRLVRGPLASRESCPGRQSRAPQHEIGAPPRCGVAPRSGPSRQLSQRFRLTNGKRAQAPRRPCAGRREGDQHDGNGAERPSSQSPQVRRSNCDAGPVSDPSSAALEAPRGELTTRWRPWFTRLRGGILIDLRLPRAPPGLPGPTAPPAEPIDPQRTVRVTLLSAWAAVQPSPWADEGDDAHATARSPGAAMRMPGPNGPPPTSRSGHGLRYRAAGGRGPSQPGRGAGRVTGFS